MWKPSGCIWISQLGDEEITKLYNKAFGDLEDLTKDKELAEEMLTASAVNEGDEKWSSSSSEG